MSVGGESGMRDAPKSKDDVRGSVWADETGVPTASLVTAAKVWSVGNTSSSSRKNDALDSLLPTVTEKLCGDPSNSSKTSSSE